MRREKRERRGDQTHSFRDKRKAKGAAKRQSDEAGNKKDTDAGGSCRRYEGSLVMRPKITLDTDVHSRK